MKKLKFGKIKVFFRDGKMDIIPKKLWDDYVYTDGLFVVKRSDVWVYVYSLSDISAIIVNNKKVKK